MLEVKDERKEVGRPETKKDSEESLVFFALRRYFVLFLKAWFRCFGSGMRIFGRSFMVMFLAIMSFNLTKRKKIVNHPDKRRCRTC